MVRVHPFKAWSYVLAVVYDNRDFSYLRDDEGIDYRFPELSEAEESFDAILKEVEIAYSDGREGRLERFPGLHTAGRGGKLVIMKETREVVKWEP